LANDLKLLLKKFQDELRKVDKVNPEDIWCSLPAISNFCCWSECWLL